MIPIDRDTVVSAGLATIIILVMLACYYVIGVVYQ